MSFLQILVHLYSQFYAILKQEEHSLLSVIHLSLAYVKMSGPEYCGCNGLRVHLPRGLLLQGRCWMPVLEAPGACWAPLACGAVRQTWAMPVACWPRACVSRAPAHPHQPSAFGIWGLNTISAVPVCSGMQSRVIKRAFYFLITTFPLRSLNFCPSKSRN